MPDRVVVFLDWQNVYKGAREAFCAFSSLHWHGQVGPTALAQHLADDSPFDRQLEQVRIYRGLPDATATPGETGPPSPGSRLAAFTPSARHIARPAIPPGMA